MIRWRMSTLKHWHSTECCWNDSRWITYCITWHNSVIVIVDTNRSKFPQAPEHDTLLSHTLWTTRVARKHLRRSWTRCHFGSFSCRTNRTKTHSHRSLCEAKWPLMAPNALKRQAPHPALAKNLYHWKGLHTAVRKSREQCCFSISSGQSETTQWVPSGCHHLFHSSESHLQSRRRLSKRGGGRLRCWMHFNQNYGVPDPGLQISVWKTTTVFWWASCGLPAQHFIYCCFGTLHHLSCSPSTITYY